MERRFAILMGINDYENDELDYCVKDVDDLKNALQLYCKFNINDIRIIPSSKVKPQKSLDKLLEKAIDSIEVDFTKKQDSLFFFFSGHGTRNTEGAVLKIHNIDFPLQKVIDLVASKLIPKHEFYVIDACYSGEKIKGKTTSGDIIENEITSNRFSLKSESYNILAAARYDQKASEKSKYQNGLLTHFFLEALNFEPHYNKFGFLSSNTISEYVLLNVSVEREFEQIPYALNKISGTFPFAFKELNKFTNLQDQTNEKTESPPINLPRITRAPTDYFHSKLVSAFPGVRGVEWFEGKVAIDGLKRFLKEPLKFEKAEGHGVTKDPIWWFRGYSALKVDRFHLLSNEKILLNSWELKIDKVGVFNGRAYWNNVIYVETLPDEPTNLYNRNKEETLQLVESYGYASDYFGYYEGRIIKPEQVEDGGGIIDGQYLEFENSEIGQRFITPYNFILVPKFSPANTREGNLLGNKYMNDILQGKRSFEEFISEYENFPRHQLD